MSRRRALIWVCFCYCLNSDRIRSDYWFLNFLSLIFHRIFNHQSEIFYLSSHLNFNFTHFSIFFCHLLFQVSNLFSHRFLTILQMSYTVMKLFILPLICPWASSTTHDSLLAKSTYMYWIVLFLINPMTHLAFKLSFFARHKMSSQARTLYSLSAVFTFNGN
jgi:hypothetical protein